MPNYEHNQLIRRIARIDTLPEDAVDYATWIDAGEHLALLRDNAEESELIVYAASRCTFAHAVVLSERSLASSKLEDLLDWSGNPYTLSAGYTWGGGRNDAWIERSADFWRSKTLRGEGQQLVFARRFEGEQESPYYEILQEYSHLADIHWRREERAYCRYDDLGDMEHSVSITPRNGDQALTLVSFKREHLEEYLAASKSVLLRMFDFMLFQPGNFTGWSGRPERMFRESPHFIYKKKVDAGQAGYARGVQVIRPSRPKSKIFASITGGWVGGQERSYCDFIAWDWRNRRKVSLSANPSASSSYFDAGNNTLPFETSPVFFRPEVLSKYKTDRDKYTINEEYRHIRCRGGWELRTYDVKRCGSNTYLHMLPWRASI